MNNIRELRKKNGINQLELAVALGVKQSTISRYETGKVMPKSDKLPEMAKILNCTIDAILNKTA